MILAIQLRYESVIHVPCPTFPGQLIKNIIPLKSQGAREAFKKVQKFVRKMLKNVEKWLVLLLTAK